MVPDYQFSIKAQVYAPFPLVVAARTLVHPATALADRRRAVGKHAISFAAVRGKI